MSDIGYSYLSDDGGYLTMYQNKQIDGLIPFTKDIDHRLVHFLRTLHYYRTNNITPCIPLYMEYQIKREDWDQIVRYIKKYKIKPFMKDCKFDIL